MEKDRISTENRLLRAVGEIIEENGLEELGVNAVAQRAGVSKMLIYRYFGTLEELIGKYIMQQDYWVNLPEELPAHIQIKDFVNTLFAEQIRQLRENKLLRRLYRWELSTTNPIVQEIRAKREENGLKLIEFVTHNSSLSYDQVQFMATLISSSVSYLAMFGDVCDDYNGIRLSEDDGWRKLENGIQDLVDKWL